MDTICDTHNLERNQPTPDLQPQTNHHTGWTDKRGPQRNARDIMHIHHRPRSRRRGHLTRTQDTLACIVLAILILICQTLSSVSAIRYSPEYTIRRRQTHCIFHKFDKGDAATFAIFISDADNDGRLAAGVQIEGPIASARIGDGVKYDTTRSEEDGDVNNKNKPPRNEMGHQIQAAIENWPSFVQEHHHRFQDAGIVHHAFHVDFTYSGESEDAMRARADFSREQREEKEKEEQRRRRETNEEDGSSDDDEEYEETNKIYQIMPEKFEPYQWTKPIKSPGWYRMCAQADDMTIYVEMDIRSSSQGNLRGIDPETGHVYTYERREELDEEAKIRLIFQEQQSREQSAEFIEAKLAAEKLEQALADQVKHDDLEATAQSMIELNNIVAKIMTKQSSVLSRIKGHENDASRNHRRIVRSGMMETVLYLMITGYQVYTIHQWLLSNSLLGR